MSLKQPSMGKKVLQAVLVNTSNKAVIQTISANINQVGQKAVGLTKIPAIWVPKWISIPLATCSSALDHKIDWLDIAKVVLSNFSPTVELIVRSSAPSEDLDTRGYYDSQKYVGNTAEELANLLQEISLQPRKVDSTGTEPLCAPIVQEFLPASSLGHLSNEYRHAQRTVDFLYEIESINTDGKLSDSQTLETRSFRLDRPVQSIDINKQIVVSAVSSGIDTSLKLLARWIASEKLRVHIEWLVYQDNLYVVQMDEDPLPPRIKPMTFVPPTVNVKPIEGLRVFIPLNIDSKYAELRKTRSHHLLQKANAFVPPIYISQNLHELDWSLGSTPPDLTHDLQKICTSKAILRFDVPCSRTDWTSLPTIGPTDDLAQLQEKLYDSIHNLIRKDIPLKDIALVAHHFIPACASAWSEARPDLNKVRIDAIWGLPDGLQSFAHDTYIWDIQNNTLKPNIRYKDRFIDVEEDGQWKVRKAYPALARDWCCDKESIMDIAQVTKEVARICDRPIRIMWFLDVIGETGEQDKKLMPWIVVERDADDQEAWGDPKSWLENNGDLNNLQKKVNLAASRPICNFESLQLFENKSELFDMGGRVVLLQPDTTVVRDRSFLEQFVRDIQNDSKPWKVLYKGSILSHALYQLRKLDVDVIPLYEQVSSPRRSFSRKLVRDLIPEKISQSGESVVFKKLNDDDYLYALRQKLIEESLEAAYADDRDDVVEELADVMAVVQALAQAIGSSLEEVNAEELRKRQKRGGFEQRLYLESSGYESENEAYLEVHKPGTAMIRKLRRDKVGLRIPLVPPLRNDHASLRLKLPSVDVEIMVTYKGHDVEVLVARFQEKYVKQLSLFDDQESVQNFV
jgi:predicted house-cleaning noncanonical NTP pyrophosphatase (MazG superfamily)